MVLLLWIIPCSQSFRPTKWHGCSRLAPSVAFLFCSVQSSFRIYDHLWRFTWEFMVILMGSVWTFMRTGSPVINIYEHHPQCKLDSGCIFLGDVFFTLGGFVLFSLGHFSLLFALFIDVSMFLVNFSMVFIDLPKVFIMCFPIVFFGFSWFQLIFHGSNK